MLEIRTTTARKVPWYLSAYGLKGENEAILPPGTRLRCERVRRGEFGEAIITLTDSP